MRSSGSEKASLEAWVGSSRNPHQRLMQPSEYSTITEQTRRKQAGYCPALSAQSQAASRGLESASEHHRSLTVWPRRLPSSPRPARFLFYTRGTGAASSPRAAVRAKPGSQKALSATLGTEAALGASYWSDLRNQQ